jgi:hypothetical protein
VNLRLSRKQQREKQAAAAQSSEQSERRGPRRLWPETDGTSLAVVIEERTGWPAGPKYANDQRWPSWR